MYCYAEKYDDFQGSWILSQAIVSFSSNGAFPDVQKHHMHSCNPIMVICWRGGLTSFGWIPRLRFSFVHPGTRHLHFQKKSARHMPFKLQIVKITNPNNIRNPKKGKSQMKCIDQTLELKCFTSLGFWITDHFDNFQDWRSHVSQMHQNQDGIRSSLKEAKVLTHMFI